MNFKTSKSGAKKDRQNAKGKTHSITTWALHLAEQRRFLRNARHSSIETLVKDGQGNQSRSTRIAAKVFAAHASLTINGRNARTRSSWGAVCVKLYMRKFRGTARRSQSSPFALGSFPLQKDLVSPIRRGAGFALVQAGWIHFRRGAGLRAGGELDSYSQTRRRSGNGKRRHASDAAHARRHRRVQTDRPCFSLQRRSRIYRSYRRAIRNERARVPANGLNVMERTKDSANALIRTNVEAGFARRRISASFPLPS